MLPVRGGTPGPLDGATQAAAPQRTVDAAASTAAERDEIIKSPNVRNKLIDTMKPYICSWQRDLARPTWPVLLDFVVQMIVQP